MVSPLPVEPRRWNTLKRRYHLVTALLCACTLGVGFYGTIFMETIPHFTTKWGSPVARQARMGLPPPRFPPTSIGSAHIVDGAA